MMTIAKKQSMTTTIKSLRMTIQITMMMTLTMRILIHEGKEMKTKRKI